MEKEQDGAPSSGRDEYSSQGHLLGWGSGEFAQHGHGVTAENVDLSLSEVSGHTALWTTLKNISCGASHTAVITDQCESYSWGNSNSGQLGCGDKGTHSSPQKVLIPSTGSSLVGVACGGRHTVWWTENGRCYSSGNNFYAQLGYDFRIPNYKENQNQTAAFSFLSSYRNFYIKVRPHLLRPLIHHKVVQVSCGEKHSLFLFDTGLVSGCGCNSSGQLGSGSREEVVSPKIIEHLDERTVTGIACGPSHSLAVTDTGELFVWGSGRACGNHSSDVLLPLRKATKHSNIVFVAGGSSHSMALSACGSVYSWGGGVDGQLGFGKTLTYLTEPRCFPKSTFEEPVSQIACGETYSAAVTVSGKLYMWGRNTYVMPWCSDGSSQFHPMRVNCQSNISKLACGSWHAAAITGYPAWQPLTHDSSDENFSETDDDFEDRDRIIELQELESQSGSDKSLPEYMKNPRSKKFGLGWKSLSVSLEEFYAPTPLPAIRPISQLTERRLSLQSCESAIIINKEEVKTSEQPHQLLSSVRSEKAEINSEDASDVQCDKTSYEFQERNKFNLEPETVKRKEDRSKKGKHPTRRHMINNKDIISRTPGKVSSAKSTRKGDLIVGSLERAKSFPVLQKHSESLGGAQRNRDERIACGNSSHTTYSQKQTVSLNSTDIVMDYQITHKEEVRRMLPPKMTRAHTYYGKMSAKPPTSKIKSSSTLREENKIKTYFDQVVRSNTKVQLLPKAGIDSKPGRDRSKVPTALPPRQRATYSSASSWRKGDQKKDVLISLSQKKEGR